MGTKALFLVEEVEENYKKFTNTLLLFFLLYI